MSTTANYSLYLPPAYIFLTMVPHVHSVILLGLHRTRWDNASPRSTAFSSSLQSSKKIPPQILAEFERSRAAHANMLENTGYVVGAALAGNLAKLDAGFMNHVCAWYLLSRIMYLVSYVKVETQLLSRLRSLIYTGGLVLLTWVYVKAARALAKNGVEI